MRFSAVVLSGIRDFKFVGPKPSQSRKANQRKRLKVVQSNHTVLSSLLRRAAGSVDASGAATASATRSRT